MEFEESESADDLDISMDLADDDAEDKDDGESDDDILDISMDLEDDGIDISMDLEDEGETSDDAIDISMDDVAKMHKADTEQCIINDLEQLTLVELDLVLQENVQIRLNILHYHTDVEVCIWVFWHKDIHELRYHDVRAKELHLKFAQLFDQLYFSELLYYLVFCHNWILHNFECYQFTR